MLERELIANRRKHWVRAVTACGSRCMFCLDMDTPRNVILPVEEVKRELDRGRNELDADKVIISGGEASLHPEFPELIAYAKSIGYDRVQTVTNGWKYADRAFYRRCIDAGLGEITFSLHGHNAELHDHLTRHPGSFGNLMKAMLRALRDPDGPIVNVDVVINKQNVGVLDKIVELCVTAGVTEFDLLHVIPQAEAFRMRDELFYDPREYLPILHKVFRLNRNPRFVIWTNRFPVSYLEGLEDLIQDPHKMLDEVNGRRFQVRRYLDAGDPLDCRDPERCVHCFIEPFCTTTDRTIVALRNAAAEVWRVNGDDIALPGGVLPFGATHIGVQLASMDSIATLRIPEGAGLEVEVETPSDIPSLDMPLRLIASTPAHLDAWLRDDRVADHEAALADAVEIEIPLSRANAEWMLAHRERVAQHARSLRIHQPSFEHMADSVANDVRDPAVFFKALDVRVRVSGLPACLAPGMQLVEPIRRFGVDLFDENGRPAVRALAKMHVRDGYLAKSERCRECRLDDRCDGIHINMIRDQGLKLARPLTTGAWADDAYAQLSARWPEPPKRLANGRKPEAPPPSLPGHGEVPEPPLDPLAVIALQQQAKRAARAAARKAE
jgi:MoaA/NifB/PqqE/SkfB family radical SAM enzyme